MGRTVHDGRGGKCPLRGAQEETAREGTSRPDRRSADSRFISAVPRSGGRKGHEMSCLSFLNCLLLVSIVCTVPFVPARFPVQAAESPTDMAPPVPPGYATSDELMKALYAGKI